MILYNVPGRTVADLANETTLRLSQVPGIVGIKDATADLGRGSELIAALRAADRHDFAVYSGDDIAGLPLMLIGGHGVISVTANVAPRLMAEMCTAALAGDLARARACNDRLLPLHRRLFVEANPIPVKWALSAMGLIKNALRLPLVPLSPHHHETVRDALRNCRRSRVTTKVLRMDTMKLPLVLRRDRRDRARRPCPFRLRVDLDRQEDRLQVHVVGAVRSSCRRS